MKICGHTMGTPELDLNGAIDFFASIGMEGIEIVVQTDYKCSISYEADNRYLANLKRRLSSAGLKVGCLTPYFNDFNSLENEKLERDKNGMKRVIEMANLLEAPSIRTYGGAFGDDETDQDNRKLNRMAQTLQELGDYAQTNGTCLALENHLGTMTTTARRTLEIVEYINHKRVGILYDQANLAFFPAEEYPEAIRLQQPYIKHVHVKDLIYRNNAPEPFCSDGIWHISSDIRTVISKIPGDGILPWNRILNELHQIGYKGWLSLEYERRWGNQDLPIYSEGLPKSFEHIAQIVRSL